MDNDPDLASTIGPRDVVKNSTPKYVLLTIDSMGDADPALVSNPDLPVIFIFNERALAKLQLSSRRIGFYIQTLKDLNARRDLRIDWSFSRDLENAKGPAQEHGAC